jgi:hypothetical protein
VSKGRTIFYSWQSDLPNRTNRGFIQDALERVAEDLRSDEALAVEPVVDRDTAGVPGSPAISDTILQKIGRADVFVPDVSIVMSGGPGRWSPNPNVIMELGYAVAELGWDRIVMVMNTAFGEVAQLPFDLRGRRVLPYSLPDAPGSPKADLRRDLERRLREAILSIVTQQRNRLREDEKTRSRALIERATQFRDERLTSIRNGTTAAGALSSSHLVCVHCVPDAAIKGELRIDVGQIDQRNTFAAPIGSTSYNSHFNADGLLRENRNGGALDGYLQLFRNGIVESVDSHMMVGRGREDGLPSTFFAISLSRFMTELVNMWRTLGIGDPACVLVTLAGLKNVPLMLPANGGYVTRPFLSDTFYLPDVVIEDFESDPRLPLRHALDVLWQAAGDSGCPYFSADGQWIGRF